MPGTASRRSASAKTRAITRVPTGRIGATGLITPRPQPVSVEHSFADYGGTMSAPGHPDPLRPMASQPPTSPWSDGTDAYPGPRPALYGSSPYAEPAREADEPEPSEPLFDRADLWTVILGTIGVLLVGVVATFVWVWLAPRATAVRAAGGDVTLAHPETKAFAGADVTFLFVTVAAGLLCGVLAAIVARHRGLAVTVALGGGGLLASLMVAWGGRFITGGPLGTWARHTSTGSHALFIQLQARPFIMAWPIAALIVTFLVALAAHDRVRRSSNRGRRHAPRHPTDSPPPIAD